MHTVLEKKVSPAVYKAIEQLDIKALEKFSNAELRPVLPCLARMSLIDPLDLSPDSVDARKTVLRILSGMEVVNHIVALLSVEFHVLETDLKKELQLK